MDLIADRGRRVTIEELNTSRLLAHARKQAHQRNFDDMLIVDVDAHHYENENYDEFLPFMENDVLRQLTHVGRCKGNRGGIMPSPGRLSGHGRPRHPLSDALDREDRRQRPLARRPARPSLDGRDERRLFLPVPDRHAQYRPASAEGDGGRAVLGLQSLAHREGAAGRPAAASTRCCACRSAIPMRALRQVETFGDRKDVGGFMVTTVRSHMPVHDNAYMKVYRAIEERGLVLSFHSGPNWGEPIFKSCNRFIAVHALGFSCYNILHLHQLGGERPGRALPQAAGDLDRIRPRLGAVPDAAARPRIHAAAVGVPAAQEEAARLHARHVLLVAADGDPGLWRRWSARSA